MPTYSYWCNKCNEEFEITKRMSEPHPKICPLCGSPKVSRLFTPPNVPCVGKSGEPHPDVLDKLHPTGYRNGIPYYANQSGLNALSVVNGPDGPRYVEHPNLAGSPPGCDTRDGRIVIVKDDK